MVTPTAERDAVAHLRTEFGMSEQRACQVLGCCRMTMRYQATRVDDGLPSFSTAYVSAVLFTVKRRISRRLSTKNILIVTRVVRKNDVKCSAPAHFRMV
jgi:hypothetical protein